MNKVLFISNYKEGTGYSNAAIDFILALDKAGVDVVPRHFNVTGRQFEVPARILELEKKSSIGCDVNIQYTLPNFMSYNGNFKNIGLFDYETSGKIDSDWTRRLNLMDEIWVTNQQQRYMCIENGVDFNKIRNIKHTSDINKYQQSYEKFDVSHIKDKFTFYFVGELNKRKNLQALLRAFHQEFDKNEDVELILKINIPGLSIEEARKHVDRYCEEVKRGLKLYKNINRYKQEILFLDRLSDRDLMRLHNTCDCFVCPSYGEGWSKPCFDAMAFGKTPIVNNVGGLREFINPQTGWLCDNHKEYCFGFLDSPSNLYTSNEYWYQINIDSLRKAMREVFENKQLKERKAISGIEKSLDFSYETIGAKMKELINV